MDLGFPLIIYEKGQRWIDWGRAHGEEFRQGIYEIAQIRRGLILDKNPALEPELEGLAREQWAATKVAAPEAWEELEGIREGSGLTVTDIVILNNYTDFRDIELPDEGCSTVYVRTEERSLAGQTWDMHRSAKDYACLILAPAQDDCPASLFLSMVGSVGMLGYNAHRVMVGVNNLNTANAEAGILWPALVKHALMQKAHYWTLQTLIDAPVASGRNYLIASLDQGECLEVMPGVRETVKELQKPDTGAIFHTNHSLSDHMKKHEDSACLSSTTHDRYALLDKKVGAVEQIDTLKDLFQDHEGYPKSICSHFESGAQDPAFTCAAAAADLTTGDFIFWRGCPTYDDSYSSYRFKLDGDTFVQV